MRDDEVDFFARRPHLELRPIDGDIGCPHHDTALPRNDEENAPIVGLRHEQRIAAAEDARGKDDVRTTTMRKQRPDGGIVECAQFVDEDARCVDHDFRARLQLRSGFHVPDERPARAFVLVEKAGRAHVVDDGRAAIDCRAGDRKREPRVVELAIEVTDAAVEPALLEIGQVAQGLRAPERSARGEIRRAGEEIVGGKAGKEQRSLVATVDRTDETKLAHDMGGVTA